VILQSLNWFERHPTYGRLRVDTALEFFSSTSLSAQSAPTRSWTASFPEWVDARPSLSCFVRA
jgi:hypothetical protein